MIKTMTIDEVLRMAIFEAVRDATAPLAAEIAQLRRELDERLPARWLTRIEAARELGLSTDTIDRMIADGRLRVRRAGRAIRIEAASLRPAGDSQAAIAAAEARRP